MDDQVVQAAQATIEAIDKKMAELGAARETLVRMFGLGVKQPAPSGPAALMVVSTPAAAMNAPAISKPLSRTCGVYGDDRKAAENREGLRLAAARLIASKGPMKRRDIRLQVGIGPAQTKMVLEHPWFRNDLGTLWLTEEGKEAAKEEVAGNGQ